MLCQHVFQKDVMMMGYVVTLVVTAVTMVTENATETALAELTSAATVAMGWQGWKQQC